MKYSLRVTVSFHCQKQMECETVDSFVTDLQLLIKDCNYRKEERMLRDEIVVRSTSHVVREKCLDEGDSLTLAKAIQIVQNFEVAQDSIKVIYNESEVHAIKAKVSKDQRTIRQPKKD